MSLITRLGTFVRPPLKIEHETMNEVSGPRPWKGQHGMGGVRLP